MATNVFLWQAASFLDECRETGRYYVTDVVNSGFVPPKGSVMVGMQVDSLIVALGIVKSASQVAQRRTRVRVEPILFLDPITLNQLAASLENKVRQRLLDAETPRELRPVRLPPSVGEALLDQLSKAEEVEVWLAARSRGQSFDQVRAQEMQESRDAVALSLEIANIGEDIRNPSFADLVGSQPGDVLANVVRNAHLADSEEDLIPEDLRRFERNTDIKLIAGHVAQFKGKDYALTVFNVNKKPLEIALGVDLVYWDTVMNIFTMVQYKRLDPEVSQSGLKDWVYKDEKAISQQLALMTIPKTADDGGSTDWRMTSPYWFKFVRRDAAKNQDSRLLKGMYVPADYLRLALNDGSLKTGPRGGFRVSYGNTRRVTRATFGELVRRGLVGTTSTQSADLMKIITDLGASGRSAIVAMKSRWSGSVE